MRMYINTYVCAYTHTCLYCIFTIPRLKYLSRTYKNVDLNQHYVTL